MILTDESPMPFGIHEGTKMANVDPKYLLFLYRKNLKARSWGKMSDVMVYITDNLQAIEQEAGEKA